MKASENFHEIHKIHKIHKNCNLRIRRVKLLLRKKKKKNLLSNVVLQLLHLFGKELLFRVHDQEGPVVVRVEAREVAGVVGVDGVVRVGVVRSEPSP